MHELRALTSEDYDEFRALRLRGFEDDPRSFATSAEAWRAASRDAVLALLEVSEKGEGGVIIGAFAGEVLIGHAGLRRESAPALRHKASLWGLFVDRAHRNTGAGSAIVEALIQDAATREGLEHIRASVPSSATTALRMLANSGFVTYGIEPRARRDSNGYVDSHYLYLDLNADDRGQ